MSPGQGIFSKMTYADANSKHFINNSSYTISAQAGKGEGFRHLLTSETKLQTSQ